VLAAAEELGLGFELLAGEGVVEIVVTGVSGGAIEQRGTARL
jgi:hypothetical protein